MKKVAIISFFSLFISLSFSAQSSRLKKVGNIGEKEAPAVQEEKETLPENGTTTEVEIKEKSSFDEIAHLENLIEAIKTKIEFVSSDKKLKREAKKTGWFNQMNALILEHQRKIEALNNKKNG